jgi:hypothetical protein
MSVTFDKLIGQPLMHSHGEYAQAFTDLDDTFASYAGKGSELVRVNSGETGLESVEALPTVPIYWRWDSDAPTASASLYDDEFNDNSMGGIWTEYDHGSIQTISEGANGLVLTSTGDGSTNKTSGVYQAIPAGDFTIDARFSVVGPWETITAIGLAVLEDASSSTGNFHFLRIGPRASDNRIGVGEFSAWNTFLAERASRLPLFIPTTFIIRIQRNGTTYRFSYSTDGIGWIEVLETTAAAMGYTPLHFGILMQNQTSGESKLIARFFRYRDSDVGTGVCYGRLVPVGGNALNMPAVSKASDYTVTDGDGLVIGDATGGMVTFTLPTAVGRGGRVFYVAKSDSSANAVRIDGAGSETINGALYVDLSTQYETIAVYSDGANWLRIAPESLSHNNLGGIQGGGIGERYHLTAAQVSALHDAVTVADSSTIDLSITGQQISAVVLPAGVDHGGLAGLGDDDHTGYVRIAPGSSARNVIQPSGDYIPIVVKGHASQTNYLTEWRNSSGGFLAAIGYDGRTGVGGVPKTTAMLYLEDVSSGSVGAESTLRVYNYGNHTAAYQQSVIGLEFTVIVNNTYAQTNAYYAGVLGRVSGADGMAHQGRNLYGGYFTVDVEDGTTLTAAGIYAFTPAVDTGGLTNGYGISIDQGAVGSGSITTLIGIRVASISAGVNNYAIYTNAGLVRLGDQLSVIGSADRIQAIVKANATQTANLTEWQNSSGTKQLYVEADGELVLAQDSKAIKLGAGIDMSLYYDGTNGYIKTDVVAASDLHVSCGTDKTVVLDEVVWQDIDFPIIIRTTGAGIPALATLNGNITMPQWQVNDANICESQEFIHSWDEGSACYWHIHLTTNGLDATNRYVRFELEYGYVNASGVWTFPATVDSGDLLIPANTTDRTQLILSLASFTPSGSKIGHHAVARLKRIASSGTAPTNNPFIPMLQMHVQCNTLGSRQIATK